MKYPIGIQTFSEIIKGKYLYIDKTALIYHMTHENAKYVFLSRPRRFGKSLLTSTLQSYFEGHKELFWGLAIEGLEKEWQEYPVFHFDMSTAKHSSKHDLIIELNWKLAKYEELYGRGDSEVNLNQRVAGLIRRAYEQTGKQVVVLIDEYDAPLLDVVHKDDNLSELRNVMRNFYSPLKACEPYLRFVFVTGITKFSLLSIFSELNNIRNVSMNPVYATICGITEDELKSRMQEGIRTLAQVQGLSEDATLKKLKDYYDGYHFAMPSPDIYNPFSLLNVFSDNRFNPYWFGSGTPTYLIEMLQKFHYTPVRLGETFEAMPEDFDAPTNRLNNAVPLLYQSGYVTIKQYDPSFNSYILGLPNREVRLGLMKSLIPWYLTSDTQLTSSAVLTMARALYRNDMEAVLECLQQFLLTVPYSENTDYEGHYQQVLYIIFSLIGEFVDIEIRTPRGRMDMVLSTTTHIYIIELKLNKNAVDAMRQIELKNYPQRFAMRKLPLVKVGINFDSAKRTISDWIIEKV